MLLKKWSNPSLFLLIFVLFKHHLYRQTESFSGIRIRIIEVEGKHSDHGPNSVSMNLYSINMMCLDGVNRVIVFSLVTGLMPDHTLKFVYFIGSRFTFAHWLVHCIVCSFVVVTDSNHLMQKVDNSLILTLPQSKAVFCYDIFIIIWWKRFLIICDPTTTSRWCQ